MTAGSPASVKQQERNNNSLIAQITSLPGFDSSKARIVKHYSSRPSPEREPILPTAAETFLPWRRDRSYQSFGMSNRKQRITNKKNYVRIVLKVSKALLFNFVTQFSFSTLF